MGERISTLDKHVLESTYEDVLLSTHCIKVKIILLCQLGESEEIYEKDSPIIHC